jgi:hypothetical protein
MDDTVLVCRAEREDRFYRLNSLGGWWPVGTGTHVRHSFRHPAAADMPIGLVIQDLIGQHPVSNTLASGGGVWFAY